MLQSNDLLLIVKIFRTSLYLFLKPRLPSTIGFFTQCSLISLFSKLRRVFQILCLLKLKVTVTFTVYIYVFN